MNPKLFEVCVGQVRQLTPRVREYLLTRVDGKALPTWTAGAHIALHLVSPSRGLLIRHYSLIGGDGLLNDPPHAYRIAVQREAHGLGSNWIHESFQVGTRLRIGPPVNGFPLDRSAAKVLLLAGGIGITPLVSMARSLLQRRRPFQMVYCGRSLDQMAYAQTLEEMCGSVLQLHGGDTGPALDIPQLLAAQSADTQVYVCGPTHFIDAAIAAAHSLNWQPEQLCSEAFVSSVMPGDQPFKVSLKRSGRDVSVRADESLLDALSNAQIPVFWDCRKGECGLCATQVLTHDGQLVHRDRYLTDADKQQGQSICLCVSRTTGNTLVLDL